MPVPGFYFQPERRAGPTRRAEDGCGDGAPLEDGERAGTAAGGTNGLDLATAPLATTALEERGGAGRRACSGRGEAVGTASVAAASASQPCIARSAGLVPSGLAEGSHGDPTSAEWAGLARPPPPPLPLPLALLEAAAPAAPDATRPVSRAGGVDPRR